MFLKKIMKLLLLLLLFYSFSLKASDSKESFVSLRESMGFFLQEEVDLFNKTFTEFKLKLVDFHFDKEHEKIPLSHLQFRSDYFRVDQNNSIYKSFRGIRPVKVFLEDPTSESNPKLFRVMCEFSLKARNLVSSRNLEPGDVLKQGDFTVGWVDVTPSYSPMISGEVDLLSKKVIRQIAKGVIFKESYLKDYFAVTRGQIISLMMSKGPLMVTEKVKSMENGKVGQKIKVMSPHSKKIIEATIQNESQVSFNL